MKHVNDIMISQGIRTASFLVVLSLLLSPSCTKSGRVYGDKNNVEISMTASSAPMTKGDVVAEFPDDIFGVYAYASTFSGGTAWKQALAASSLYLDNVKFKCSRNGEGEVIARGDGTPYYWPFDGSLLMYGYSPQIETSQCVKSVAHNPNVQSLTDANAYFAIDFQQSLDPEQMEEILWFDAKDVKGGLSLSGESGVIVNFKRAHARVVFNLNYTYYKSVSVKLTECIYRGIFYSGATPGWLPDASQTDGKYTYLTSYEMFGDARSVDEYQSSVSMFMMPQYTDGFFDEVGIQLGGDMLLEITVEDGDLDVSTTVTKSLKDYTEKWEMGHEYTYNINVTPKSIHFAEPEVKITTEPVII